MKSLVIVLVVAVAATQAINFKDCKNFDNRPYGDPWQVSLNPEPLVIKEGGSIKLHYAFKAVKEMPIGTKVELTVQRNGNKIPCLPVRLRMLVVNRINH